MRDRRIQLNFERWLYVDAKVVEKRVGKNEVERLSRRLGRNQLIVA